MEIDMNPKQLAVFAILMRDIDRRGAAPLYMQEKYETISKESDKPEYMLDGKNLLLFNIWKENWGIE
jgi:hypothetical protein|tara:strand:+ start:325 stop:525 length:201 start_codon:yes stop_codon:yes gene_type:complete